MRSGETSSVTFRVGGGPKAALSTVAERDHRSIANMVEVLIQDYRDRSGTRVRERHEGSSEVEDKEGSIK